MFKGRSGKRSLAFRGHDGPTARVSSEEESEPTLGFERTARRRRHGSNLFKNEMRFECATSLQVSASNVGLAPAAAFQSPCFRDPKCACASLRRAKDGSELDPLRYRRNLGRVFQPPRLPAMPWRSPDIKGNAAAADLARSRQSRSARKPGLIYRSLPPYRKLTVRPVGRTVTDVI
ncbi:hypothetical protein AAFF_G00332010 [Aldrovandia affinis]|uniref:Uncharacterized protein n=1 Tax=Aldrovandia affinis TaxID=143900 RepID=A0AAD7SLE4_9TELE|nr:hypothetical protein AAFF_G00332010 [Aldrovandia affinis]